MEIAFGTASGRGGGHVRNKLCDICKNGCDDTCAEIQWDTNNGDAGCTDVEAGFYADAEEGCEDNTGGLDCDGKELEIASVAEW